MGMGMGKGESGIENLESGIGKWRIGERRTRNGGRGIFKTGNL